MTKKVVAFSHELFKAVLAEYQKLLKQPDSKERNRELDRIRAEFLNVALYRALQVSDPEATFWTCYEMVYGDGPKKIPVSETITMLRRNVENGHVPSCWLLGTILTDTRGLIPDEHISRRQGNLLIARAARKGYAPAMTALIGLYGLQLSKNRYYSQKAYALAHELAARDYPTGWLYLAECALQTEEPGPKGRKIALEYFEKALKTIRNLDFVDHALEGRVKLRSGIFFYEEGRKDEGLLLIREADQYEWEAEAWLRDHNLIGSDYDIIEPYLAEIRSTPVDDMYSFSSAQDLQVIKLKKPFSFELARDKELEEKKSREFTAEEIETILKPLDDLIGLDEVKKQVRELVGYAQVLRRRRKAGLSAPPLGMHMVFSGNPGTGKTTVARVLGKVLTDLGYLKTGNVVEVDRSGLVGEYIGETAQKTRRAIANARGGILFIDEAHALIQPQSQRDFGWEVVDTLVKAMEDRRDDFVVIAAGYKGEIENFLNANTGLASRFTWHIAFPDYEGGEMVQIFEKLCRDADYALTAEAAEKLRAGVRDLARREGRNFANGRTARKLFETTLRVQAERLMREDVRERDALMTILPEDIKFDFAVSDGTVTFLPKK